VTAWKHEGVSRLGLRIFRFILKPIFQWDIFYVFQRDLNNTPAEGDLPAAFEIRIYLGNQDLEETRKLLSPYCPNFDDRARRREAVVLCRSTSGLSDDEIAGYTWIAFSDTWAEELQLTIIVCPGEMVHYDSYVHPRYRGQGLHTSLVIAAKHFALRQGCCKSLSWISALNLQSLKTAQRLAVAPEQPLTVLSIKTIGMRGRWNCALRGSLDARCR
jgi:GNAT superfamily N-acetyltransferase